MRSSELALNRAGDARWLSFPLLDAFPFVLHGFLVKNQQGSKAGEVQPARNFLHRITSDKRGLVSLTQRHKDRCVVIAQGDKLKRSYQGDAILTDRADILITIQVADCLPIYLVEEKRRVIGLVHAGWRGTLLGIVPKTLNRAESELGCRVSEFTVLIGPCIQGSCYQVSASLAVLFDKRCIGVRRGNKTTVDLTCANVKQLVDYGVKEDRIFESGECTCCNGDLFVSHRREGSRAGRMTAFMGLK